MNRKLVFERIRKNQAKTLYHLRNHPTVRKYLANNKALNYREHLNWFQNKLLPDKNQIHFLVKYRDQYIGFVLLRNINKKEAEIGIFFKKTIRTTWPIVQATVFILNYGFVKLKLNKLYSYVSPKNHQATKFNKGFSGKIIKSDKIGLVKYIFKKTAVNKNIFYQRFSRSLSGAGKQDIFL